MSLHHRRSVSVVCGLLGMSDGLGRVDFPTLGDLLDAWYEAHCSIPDSVGRRIPFHQSDWQFWCTANHYRVREDAKWNPDRPLLASAFVYRRSLIVAPQKTGKGPWSAAITTGEAVGPAMFAGWAKAGDAYLCSENGCGCGFEWEYEPGEPMGMRRPGPLIQLLASSEAQVGNVYGPLTTMLLDGPLTALMAIREGFIRVLDGDGGPKSNRIDVVSSSAKSRLGQPITFAIQDETGLYTKENRLISVAQTQRRGLAGMGGRSIETTNAWDPAENSLAQQTFQSQSRDIFKFYRQPPTDLSYRNKRDRAKIHRYVYDGSPWVNLSDIEAEASELMETDPAQAERFFGNRLVSGAGAWLKDGVWDAAYAGGMAASA
jgi:hypothetical protein